MRTRSYPQRQMTYAERANSDTAGCTCAQFIGTIDRSRRITKRFATETRLRLKQCSPRPTMTTTSCRIGRCRSRKRSPPMLPQSRRCSALCRRRPNVRECSSWDARPAATSFRWLPVSRAPNSPASTCPLATSTMRSRRSDNWGWPTLRSAKVISLSSILPTGSSTTSSVTGFSAGFPGLQDAIFRICSQNLVPNGIAYISYNVLPGWHLRKIVRDICAYHAGTDGTPQYRVARARWMLEQVAKLSSDATNFGRILRDEAKLTTPLPDSYILGEFLADENTPSYFHEFVDRAADHDLTFLSETNLAVSIPENHGAEQAKLIRAIAGSSGVLIEQYIDFFTGRPFRRSLLIKSAQASKIERKLSPQRLRSLHFAGQLRLDSAVSKGATAVFTHEQRSMTTNDPIVRRAMELLASAYPATCSLEELIGGVGMSDTTGPPPDRIAIETRLLDALFKAVAALYVSVSTLPLKVGRAAAARPTVCKVARLQATNGQSWASSRQHRPVALHPATCLLVPFMDGTQDRGALRHRLADALRNRQIAAEEVNDDAALANPVALEAIAATMLDQMLRHLEENALLELNAR